MERREFARYAVELPLSFSGSGVAGGGLVAGLSAHGCTVVSDELLQPTTSLVLSIQLPEQSAPLRVDLADVRWADGRDCGLEFRRLRLEEKQRLQRFLGALEKKARSGDYRQAG